MRNAQPVVSTIEIVEDSWLKFWLRISRKGQQGARRALVRFCSRFARALPGHPFDVSPNLGRENTSYN